VPADIDDAALERELFPPVAVAPDAARPLPDWKEVQKELKRRKHPAKAAGDRRRPDAPASGMASCDQAA
jgi:hypothetical protein